MTEDAITSMVYRPHTVQSPPRTKPSEREIGEAKERAITRQMRNSGVDRRRRDAVSSARPPPSDSSQSKNVSRRLLLRWFLDYCVFRYLIKDKHADPFKRNDTHDRYYMT